MRVSSIAAALAAGLLAASSTCAQNLITNGDFETGDLTGWNLVSTGGFGDWVINDGVSVVFGGPASQLAPIAGNFDLTQGANGPGNQKAATSFVVPPGITSAFVSWTDTIRNFAGVFQDPGQEFSVYFTDQGGAQVGPMLFSTDPGDLLMPPTATRAVDVTGFLQSQVGNTLDLTFESDATVFFMHPSIDDVGVFINQSGGPASADVIGAGCPNGGAIYELFTGASEDVANSAFTFTPTIANNGYVLTQSGASMDVPVNAVTLGDDEVLQALPVGFSFVYPGGTTNTVDVSSNGYVYLQSGTLVDSRCCDGDPLRFANESASIAVFGGDLDPSAGGQVFVDSLPGQFNVTWIGVPNFGTAVTVDAQVQIHDDGRIVLIYGANATSGGNDTIIGVSTGMVGDPGSRDLTAASGETFLTLDPLELTSSGDRPVLGTSFRWTVRDIPAGSISGFVLLGFTPLAIDLGSLGAPGCTLMSSGLEALPFVALVPVSTTSLNIPNRPALSGVSLESQALVIRPGINPLSIITSNGLRLTLGGF